MNLLRKESRNHSYTSSFPTLPWIHYLKCCSLFSVPKKYFSVPYLFGFEELIPSLIFPEPSVWGGGKYKGGRWGINRRGGGTGKRNRCPGWEISPNSPFWSASEMDKINLSSRIFLALWHPHKLILLFNGCLYNVVPQCKLGTAWGSSGPASSEIFSWSLYLREVGLLCQPASRQILSESIRRRKKKQNISSLPFLPWPSCPEGASSHCCGASCSGQPWSWASELFFPLLHQSSSIGFLLLLIFECS